MAIKLENVTHIYNPESPFEKEALSNVTLHIPKGQFVGLIGHTGSGKSTLIQHLNGLMKPTSGTICINEKDIHSKEVKLKEIREQVGLVFQYPEYQLFEMTIYKDVAFGPKNMGLSEDEIKERVISALSMVNIGEEMYEKSPFELSGGQKRRVAIAGVLAMRPDILVLDEPTAGLDPRGREEILDQISQMHKTLGITVILVSHSMEDVARYVDRLVVMEKGGIALDGKPREVFNHIEELEAMGLAAPQIRYIMQAIIQKGMNIKADILTVEEAADIIAAYLKQGGHKK
ncbi:MAG TPA: energy-coupling factor transporter ATPase [Epulopiscium sp.]|nr:energy-coupling factor transporter ATPase [Candidatus Epulonipiscium sp.]